MKIYFIRHGETLWNTLRIFQGSSNSPLTPKGEEQAKKLGKRLENTNFTKFYSSPLGRAIQTSEFIIGERDIEIDFIEEFREISVGDMEGVPASEFEAKYPQELHNFFLNPSEYNPTAFNGETFPDFLARIEKGLNKLVENHSPQDIVAVVTHGMTLKGIFKVINDTSFTQLTDTPVPQNTSLSIINYEDGKFSIEMFSDTKHLECEEG